MEASLTWPPSYTIKKNDRARHVRLKASVQHGLEVVVPKRFNSQEIPEILEKNRSWIEKQLKAIHSQLITSQSCVLPTEITFANHNQTWKIEYLLGDTTRLRLITRPRQRELVLFGNIHDHQLCKKGLSTWSKNQAKIHLVNQLIETSREIQLSYHKVTVRDQSSVWGSCSANKSINLNYKLLFLPTELTRYVLIHELCHTVHLNHSDKFWRLVEKFDPAWQVHRKRLRHAAQFIPHWIST